MSNKLNIKVTFAGGGTVTPKFVGEGGMKLVFTRYDDGRMGYTRALKGKITFTDEVSFLQMVGAVSSALCDWVAVNVYRECGGVERLFYTGRMTPIRGRFDYDRRTVEVEIEEINKYTPFDDAKDNEVNLLANIGVPDRIVLYLQGDGVMTELLTYSDYVSGGSYSCYDYITHADDTDALFELGAVIPPSISPDLPGSEFWTWRLVESTYNRAFLPSAGEFRCWRSSVWAREFQHLPSGVVPSDAGWQIVAGGGTAVKWVRPAIAGGEKKEEAHVWETLPDSGSQWLVAKWRRKWSFVGGEYTAIDNGMRLADVAWHLVKQAYPDYTIKSDFFQINPFVWSDLNPVTGEPSFTNKIGVWQKSDVKRWNASENATKAVWTLKGFFNALVEMFNVRWDVDPVTKIFLIEHVSSPKFQNTPVGLNLTVPPYLRAIQGKRQWSFNTDEIPAREVFSFMEASEGDFKGVALEYTNACGQRRMGDEVTHDVMDVTTDLELVLENPEPDSNVVSMDGFVFVAMKTSGSKNVPWREVSILDQARFNNVLGWAFLHDRFYRHYRYLNRVNMNEVIQTVGTRPNIKGDRLVVPFCCDTLFDFKPENKVRTFLGNGIVTGATYNVKDETMEFELLYQQQPPL